MQMDIHAFGFYRVAAAVPFCTVGNCGENAKHIESAIQESSKKGADLVVFPALALSSASCGDLFKQYPLLEAAQEHLCMLVKKTAHIPLITVLGFPFLHENRIYNAIAVFSKGTLYGIVALDDLSPSCVFSRYECSCTHFLYWNELQALPIPFGTRLFFTTQNRQFSFCIGLAAQSAVVQAALCIVPLAQHSSPLLFDSLQQTYTVLSQQMRKSIMYVNAGWGESSAEGVYAGESGIIERGDVLAAANGFQFFVEQNRLCYDFCKDAALCIADVDCSGFLNTSAVEDCIKTECITVVLPPCLKEPLMRPRNAVPFIPLAVQADAARQKLFFLRIIEMQAQGLAKRMRHTNSRRMIIGISGGLDSTLALLIAHAAASLLSYPSSDIIAITMPGFGTTGRTKANAVQLAELLGCTSLIIPIKKALLQHFADINHDPNTYTTVYENAQARERTQILMDKANQMNALLIGTGDLSESALGWETYNGDHMSMYGVNAGIPKTLLKYCIAYYIDYPPLCVRGKEKQYRRILNSILATPISPELLPAENQHIIQKTEDILGPYELHDFFLYYLLHTNWGPKKIFFLAEQTFCTPPSKKYEKKQVLDCLHLFYRRFFSQQFKRSCMPDAPSVGLGSFSPRGAWQMPSDACADVWFHELAQIT